MTQMELDQQLGGLYSLLTVEFLLPYSKTGNLLLHTKTGAIPRIPEGVAKPTIVAGINALGRGQAPVKLLVMFITTLACKR